MGSDARHSPFTKALLANLERPGVEISALMTDVRKNVYEETGKRQIPWTNSSLLGRFYFVPKAEAPAPAVASLFQAPQSAQPKEDFNAWKKIANSQDRSVLRSFVDRFGSGSFGDIARLKLKAQRWIKRPRTFSTINISGKFDVAMRKFAGRIHHRECGSIRLVRAE